MTRSSSRAAVLALAGLALHASACTSRDGATREASATEATARQGAPLADIDWKAVDSALGRRGTMQDGGVYRYGMPRSDLTVTSEGVRIAPALALGSWLAFKATGGDEAVAMGDLVLTEAEYGRVIARLQEGDVGQTAVHKHLRQTSPALWWTHIHARGDPVRIARTVRAALALTGTPAQDVAGAPPAGPTAPIELDTAQIHQVLGRAGTVSGGVYHVSVPRAETIRAGGIELPAAMGTATALNFQPTGGGKAAINGDVVMTAAEVNPVIAALTAHGIQVVAVHNHMLDEEPRLFFLHFWANDDAVTLARGLRAALDRTNSARPAP
ncbi:MAG TPA: DUF1259 domain-containing protein [Gemmatimonadaceae bacterium]|nr:DUF1259 domain-containing protein [Gemmatimonadaceae bacterium]